jgi:hypothetical protein
MSKPRKDTSDYNREYYNRPDVKESHSKYMKEYYKKNKEKLLKKQSEYYENNKEKIRNYMKKYMREYKKNKKSDVVKSGKGSVDSKG